MAESVSSILMFEVLLRTDNSLLRVIKFVYYSCKQHEIFLNVFPTFSSHHDRDI